MTANPFAALLDGVPRLVFTNQDHKPEPYIKETDVLAALAAAVPDDLAEAGKVVDEFAMSARIWTEAAEHTAAPTFSRGDCRAWAERFTKANDLITALLARIAAQQAQIATKQARIDTLHEALDAEEKRAEAAETALAAMTKERDKAMEWAKEQHGCADLYADALAAERAKTAKLVEAGDFAKFIGTDTSKDDKDLVLVTYGMLRQLRAAITEAGQ